MGKINDLLGERQTKKVNEADVQKIIKELINTGWSGDNESQMKAVQLLKGLATSDEPAANSFMHSLDQATSNWKKTKFESKDEEDDDEDESEEDDDEEESDDDESYKGKKKKK